MLQQQRFLQSVAKYLAQNPKAFSTMCLVFPNKRAAMHFRRNLRAAVKTPTIMPTMITAAALDARIVPGTHAPESPYQPLIILYKCYLELCATRGLTPMEFDRFAFWGTVIINDFNDVDRSLADATSVFTNLERLNEISANFLTSEQKAVIAEIWGEDRAVAIGGDDNDATQRMWKHVQDAAKNSNAARRFVRLWQLMHPLYQLFRREMEKSNVATPQMLERLAVNRVGDDVDSIGFNKVVFIGFINPSVARLRMMDILQRAGKAIFFWDVLPDAEQAPYAASASAHMRRLEKKFAMPPDYTTPGFTRPAVTVLSSPSNFLQAKMAGQILGTWASAGLSDGKRPDSTAVVLPDDALLAALLHSLPSNLGTVNITMGLSYRRTPFASLLRSVAGMHIRRRFIHGRTVFFRTDVAAAVANPMMRTIAPDASARIIDHIAHGQYHIDAETLQNMSVSGPLKHLFTDVDANDPEAVRQWLVDMARVLKESIETLPGKINASAHEVKVLEAYTNAASDLFRCMQQYNVSPGNENTLFGMLDRLLGVGTLNMSGMPLAGTQVMGVLETRALDFDNVILLSMNERIFPRRGAMRTLVPQQLRRAYGMPTGDDEDLQSGVLFYSLLNRANNVVCLYDARTAGISSGAPSRFLLQLRYLPGLAKVEWKNFNSTATASLSREIVVQKDEKVLQRLMRFKSQNPDEAMKISASSLKAYRKCPLMFYMDYVLNIRSDNEPVPYMDAATYGSILHATLEDMFNSLRTGATHNPVRVDADTIKTMVADYESLVQRVMRHANRLYHRQRYDGRLDAMPSETLLLSRMIADFIVRLLEATHVPFNFLAAEKKVNSVGDTPYGQWKASDKNTVNVRMDIDRLDSLDDGTIRIVDYKTGADTNKALSVQALFGNEHDSSNDAALQLLFYSVIYSELVGFDGVIEPSLIRVRDAFVKPSNTKRPIEEDHLIFNDTPDENVKYSSDLTKLSPEMAHNASTFRKMLGEMVDEIFDVNTPFKQCDDSENCKYCGYADMCRRISKSK